MPPSSDPIPIPILFPKPPVAEEPQRLCTLATLSQAVALDLLGFALVLLLFAL